MQQLINALLKYKNSLFYLGLLLLSLIFLNQRSFYHQSFFSDISLSISSRINLYSQGIVNYFSLKKINEQLRLENEMLKVLELAYQNNKVDKTAVLESFGFKKYSADDPIKLPETTEFDLPKSSVKIPAINYRTTNYYDARDEEYASWNKLSSRDSWGLFVHTYEVLVPPEKYGKTNPE